MAYYITESEEFKKTQHKKKLMGFDEIIKAMERDGLLK